MFALGFEKIAVSSEYVLKRIVHRVSPTKVTRPAVHKELSKVFDQLGLTGMPSKDNPLLRMLVGQTRANSPKPKINALHRFARKNKNKLIGAGAAAATGAGAAYGMHKYKQGKQDEQSRISKLRHDLAEEGL